MIDKKDDENKIDYKKAFDLLLVMMIAKTISPDEPEFGSPDMCWQCIKQGHNFAYGDDGNRKSLCDECPNCPTNLTACMPNDLS